VTVYSQNNVYCTGRLAMIDVAEVNPNIGDERDVNMTVKTTIDVITRFYGQRRQGITPTNYEIPTAVLRRNSNVNIS